MVTYHNPGDWYTGWTVHPNAVDRQTASGICWTYPGSTAAVICLAGNISQVGGNGTNAGVDYHIVENNSSNQIAYGLLPSRAVAQIDSLINVSPGDRIFIDVGAPVSAICDATALNLTFTVVPEPVTLSLLALGGLALLRRRR
jgi:hypothetical protein